MQTHELERVLYEKDEQVARIVLNYPEKANVQDSKMVWDVEQCLEWADRDEEVKVLVVRANGRGFCAGHAIDLGEDTYPEFGGSPERTWKGQYDLFIRPVLNLWEFPKITVSAVHGYCLGGGTCYGLMTDLTVAADDAYFQMPLPQGFGLPGAETMIEPWIFMNAKQVYEYLLLAPTLTAEDALAKGLVNNVVPRDSLEDTVEDMARTITQMPMTTIMSIKAGVKRAWELMGMRSHLQYSNDLLSICTGASDVRQLHEDRAGMRPRQYAARQAGDDA